MADEPIDLDASSDLECIPAPKSKPKPKPELASIFARKPVAPPKPAKRERTRDEPIVIDSSDDENAPVASTSRALVPSSSPSVAYLDDDGRADLKDAWAGLLRTSCVSRRVDGSDETGRSVDPSRSISHSC